MQNIKNVLFTGTGKKARKNRGQCSGIEGDEIEEPNGNVGGESACIVYIVQGIENSVQRVSRVCCMHVRVGRTMSCMASKPRDTTQRRKKPD